MGCSPSPETRRGGDRSSFLLWPTTPQAMAMVPLITEERVTCRASPGTWCFFLLFICPLCGAKLMPGTLH